MGDDNAAADQRHGNLPGTKLEIIHSLQDLLYNNNHLIRSFKFALLNVQHKEFDIVIHADKTPVGEHQRRYNAPNSPEVAAVVTGLEHGKRDIVIQQKNSQLKRISQTNQAHDGLQYPLIYTIIATKLGFVKEPFLLQEMMLLIT